MSRTTNRTVYYSATTLDGFLAAVEAADVELILVSYDVVYGGWRLTDTLANLQADARTAGIPLFVFGPYDLRYTRPNLEQDFPGIRWVVPPADAAMLEKQLKGRPAVLTEPERVGYAREAAALLARIAADGGVSLETVRSQLKHVFEKTHTRRQSELIGLLTRVGSVARR